MSMKTRGGAKNFWICKTCTKKFTKVTDKLMECEYCENHFCSECLQMNDKEYEHHIHSSGMWFCGRCKPKVEETLKVEKEIEKRCEEHFQKYCKRLESIEKKLEKKVEIQDVVALINEKSEKDKAKHKKDKIVTEQLKEKQIIDLVKQVETKSVTDIVKKHLQESSISEQNVNKLVDEKIKEIDKQITDRQSRERNVIIFRIDEPNTNLIKERQAKDLETLKEMIEQIAVESEEEIKIDKIIRLGTRGTNFKDNPRPAVVSFASIESKKFFLRNSNILKGSANEKISKVAISNDLTKKDRERELELVAERNQKKLFGGGSVEICDTGPTRGQKVAKNKKTHISAISNLKCMYTNCYTLTNKTSELKLAIDSNHPDIIVLTEVTPKNKTLILQKSEIEIKGYNLYISDFEETNTRGVAVYVKRVIPCQITQCPKRLRPRF